MSRSVVLGHGASGSAASMRPHVEGLRARGISARAVDLPRGAAERAMPVFAAELDRDPDAIIGGQSFGGRVASLVAAERTVSGLVLLSYPLHRPGHPDELRTEHLPHITCPVLLLSGESDPFARIDLLRAAVALLPDAELVTYPRLGHGLIPVLDDVLDRVAAFAETMISAGGLPPGTMPPGQARRPDPPRAGVRPRSQQPA